MRNVFLLLLLSLNICCSQKQPNYQGFDSVTNDSSIKDLQGKWGINELITKAETKEYSLYPDKTDGNSYGNNITLNADQTFKSSYSAWCGNDCFTTTTGKYKIIDKNYICFYLEKITRSGECSGNSEPNEDLGLYYYYKKENSFRLLRSSGSLEKDKKNVLYRDLIVAKREEIKSLDKNSTNNFIFNWKRTDLKDEKDIVEFCMNENQIKDYEILYSDKGDRYSTQLIILVKVNGEYRFVIYDTWGRPMVSLFNDFQIKKIDKLVNEIDNDKSLTKNEKKTFIPGKIESQSKILTTYKKKDDICKVIYATYTEYGKKVSLFIKTIYLQNSIPVYVDYQTTPNQNEGISQTGLYVLDWQNNKGASKIIKHNQGYRNEYLQSEKTSIIDIMQQAKNLNN